MTDRLYYFAYAPFEAARYVDILPEKHPSRRLHGHSFQARVQAALPPIWATFPGADAKELSEALHRAVHPLDYCLLNDIVAVPTDENLARWVRSHLYIPKVEVVGIKSTRNQGVDLDQNNNAHIWRRFRFEAAHQLPNVSPGHQCGRMHGHGFEVILHANQSLSDKDMGVDFDLLETLWTPLYQELHHTCLNDIAGLENPTSEMIATWLWKKLKPQLQELSWITVYETNTAGCHYDGSHYRIWKEFRFESALRLQRAPVKNPRRQLHGHSYILRVHLTAPLDEIMGWTVDYGDVKNIFKPIYNQLDHHLLNELSDIGDADLSTLLFWIKTNLASDLPYMDRLDLFEDPCRGATLSWGEHSPALPR